MTGDEDMPYKDVLDEIKVFRPKILNLMITERCNYLCSFCNFHKKSGEMPFELAIRIINESQNAGIKTIAFTGGEPLLYKGIFDLIRLIKTYGMSPHITTNGSLVDNSFEEIIDSGLDSMSFSVDGYGDTHDRLRGVKGSFDNIERVMTRLDESSKVLLFINMVVTRFNVKEILKVYEFARSHRATFFFWPVNDVEMLYMDEANREEYLFAVKSICDREGYNENMRRFLEMGIDYHIGKIRRFRCPAFFSTVNINFDGEVMPCCVWGAKELSAGNIKENGLIDILGSEKAKDIVKGIFDRGCYNRCYNSMLPEFSNMFNEDFILWE